MVWQGKNFFQSKLIIYFQEEKSVDKRELAKRVVKLVGSEKDKNSQLYFFLF